MHVGVRVDESFGEVSASAGPAETGPETGKEGRCRAEVGKLRLKGHMRPDELVNVALRDFTTISPKAKLGRFFF